MCSVLDDVLGSFGYGRSEGDGTIGKQRQLITSGLWPDTIRIRIPQTLLSGRSPGA